MLHRGLLHSVAWPQAVKYQLPVAGSRIVAAGKGSGFSTGATGVRTAEERG